MIESIIRETDIKMLKESLTMFASKGHQGKMLKQIIYTFLKEQVKTKDD